LPGQCGNLFGIVGIVFDLNWDGGGGASPHDAAVWELDVFARVSVRDLVDDRKQIVRFVGEKEAK
jgi:hypothetical protein